MDASTDIRLVSPTEQCRESFLRAMAAFREEGLPWWLGDDLKLAQRDFAAFVARKRSEASPDQRSDVTAKTHLWAVTDAFVFVGRIAIHHRLNDALRLNGGHIGYDTVPPFRGRGIASEMLRQALPVAATLGLNEVLVTCDDTNAASIRVIEKNGGVLREIKTLEPGQPRKRYYWIACGEDRL